MMLVSLNLFLKLLYIFINYVFNYIDKNEQNYFVIIYLVYYISFPLFHFGGLRCLSQYFSHFMAVN